MLRSAGKPTKTPWACEMLRDYLFRHGPATAQDLLKTLALSPTATYEAIRKASDRGLIRAVAHVHSDRNHGPRAWDIDSPDADLMWRRRQRLVGRFCTCLRERPSSRRVASG